MITTETKQVCKNCGFGAGVHAYDGDFCPMPGGGFSISKKFESPTTETKHTPSYQEIERDVQLGATTLEGVKWLLGQHKAMLEALEQADLQIEYMQSKFKETGTGNAVRAQIQAVIQAAKGAK